MLDGSEDGISKKEADYCHLEWPPWPVEQTLQHSVPKFGLEGPRCEWLTMMVSIRTL